MIDKFNKKKGGNNLITFPKGKFPNNYNNYNENISKERKRSRNKCSDQVIITL